MLRPPAPVAHAAWIPDQVRDNSTVEMESVGFEKILDFQQAQLVVVDIVRLVKKERSTRSTGKIGGDSRGAGSCEAKIRHG
jgi:hypothetical protein